MSSGVRKAARGSFVGTGALINVDTPGFKPGIVNLYNLVGICVAHWQDSMPDGSMIKTVDSGSGTSDIVNVTATTGITPRANGFSLGADTDLNVVGEVVHWEAEE